LLAFVCDSTITRRRPVLPFAGDLLLGGTLLSLLRGGDGRIWPDAGV